MEMNSVPSCVPSLTGKAKFTCLCSHPADQPETRVCAAVVCVSPAVQWIWYVQMRFNMKIPNYASAPLMVCGPRMWSSPSCCHNLSHMMPNCIPERAWLRPQDWAYHEGVRKCRTHCRPGGPLSPAGARAGYCAATSRLLRTAVLADTLLGLLWIIATSALLSNTLACPCFASKSHIVTSCRVCQTGYVTYLPSGLEGATCTLGSMFQSIRVRMRIVGAKRLGGIHTMPLRSHVHAHPNPCTTI